MAHPLRCFLTSLLLASTLAASFADAREWDRYRNIHTQMHAAGEKFAIPAVPYGGDNEPLWLYPNSVKQWFDNNVTGVTLSTPVFTSNHGSFEQGGVSWAATQEEMLAYLRGLTGPYMKMQTIGEIATRDAADNVEAVFDIPLLVFSKPSVFDAEALKALNKPIVYIQAMIHGNEPSGGEGALLLASKLANDELRVLDKISVVILPRYNVDGAWKFQRGTDAISPVRVNMDQNRDHTAFESPITRIMHTVANLYKPHVAIDLHEMGYDLTADYLADGSLLRVRDFNHFDLSTLVAHLYNVPSQITDIAREFDAGVSADLNKRGLGWTFYYYPWAFAQEDARVQSGDAAVPVSRDVVREIMEGVPDEAMGDSVLSLIPSIGMLFESRSPQVLVNYKNRTWAHYTGIESVVTQTAARGNEILTAVEQARQEMARLGETVEASDTISLWVRQAKIPSVSFPVLRMSDDNQTLFETTYTVDAAWRNFTLTPVESVVRPFAYLISTDQNADAVIERLSYTGARIERLAENTSIPVEAYTIISTDTDPGDRGGDYFPMRGLTHVITSVARNNVTRTFPKGTYVVYMNQASSTHAALALEPLGNRNFGNYWLSRRAEGLNGWVGFLPAIEGSEYAVYRYMTATRLDSNPVDLTRPFVDGARIVACLPIDKERKDTIERQLQGTMAHGFRFMVEGSANPFTLVVPDRYNDTSLGSWRIFNWSSNAFDRAATQGTSVKTLSINNEHVSSTGEVLVVAQPLGGGDEGGSGGCNAGIVSPGMGLLLLVPLLARASRR